MVIKILVFAAVVIGAFSLYVAFLPGDFRIERSIAIDAPPQVVFRYLNNPRLAEEWNPFSKVDPNIKMKFEGTEGVGATASWVGNAQAGEGSLTIIESVPNERVRVRLDFKKPFEGTNFNEYSLKSDGAQTVMTWTMTGKSAFIPRAICVFVSMEKMMGGQFEKGLAQLKAVTEQSLAKN